jgi:hypothetical protein
MFKFGKLASIATLSAGTMYAGSMMAGSNDKPEIKSAHSLTAKYVTDNIWDLYKNHSTKTADFTLK